ncbi:MAG: hypothetical protein IPF93_00015 [Saprospiraceae bacterium]|nr:hypothetical protein [Saprospiraceae bacterium]
MLSHRYLYVAVPGIRNYLEYGGHGMLVSDIDKGHKFVKRISTQGMGLDGKPANVKGIAVSLTTQCVYVTTTHSRKCIQGSRLKNPFGKNHLQKGV